VAETDRHPDQDGEGDPRPWEQPGAFRRDCAPHRGHLVQLLTRVCAVVGLASCSPFPALLGLPLGLLLARLCRGDLARMDAGTMDPGGRRLVESALRMARIGWVLSFISLAFWGVVLALVAFLSDGH
jgi:hypothetical protein